MRSLDNIPGYVPRPNTAGEKAMNALRAIPTRGGQVLGAVVGGGLAAGVGAVMGALIAIAPGYTSEKEVERETVHKDKDGNVTGSDVEKVKVPEKVPLGLPFMVGAGVVGALLGATGIWDPHTAHFGLGTLTHELPEWASGAIVAASYLGGAVSAAVGAVAGVVGGVFGQRVGGHLGHGAASKVLGPPASEDARRWAAFSRSREAELAALRTELDASRKRLRATG